MWACFRDFLVTSYRLITSYRHTINLTSGRSKDGAFAHYSTVCAVKAAILPDEISFVDGVVIPFAFEAAVCALSLQESTIAMPGVSTPALGLPYPSLDPKPSGKVLVVNGASASSGSMVTQLATAAGVKVMAIAGAKNHDMVKQLGAVEVFDRADTGLVDKIVRAVQKTGEEFIGIFDSVSEPETTSRDLEILEQLGGGHLACTHPPPAKVPANVQAGMIFAVNDVANPVWESYVTRALEQGKLKCFPPPTVVGKGLEYVNEALRRCKDGVSATKLVVEL